MNHSPSQTKTPKSKKDQMKAPEHTPSDPAQQISPQSLERYLPLRQQVGKDELPLASESHFPTIFRKHQYEGKQFTEIHDLRTGVKAVRSRAPIKYTLSDFNEVAEIGSFMVNVSSLNAEQAYRKTEWRELYRGDKFCKCAKSECLKNYCSCHQKKAFCTSDCLCVGCRNRSRNEIHFSVEEQQRVRSRERTKKEQLREGKRLQQNDLGLTNVCACKRSKNCKKSYCGCYRAGINCSSQCGCSDCKN